MTPACPPNDDSRNPLPACSCCGGPLYPRLPVARDPLTGDRFEVAACSVCGLGHTVPSPADLGPYYPGSYYGGRHGFTASWCVRRRLAFVSRAFGESGEGRLLDVGCGDGSFLLAARRIGWTVYGTERDPERARSAGLDVAESLGAVASAGPFACVTMWHSLEHMPDAPAALADIRNLLAPNGRLLVAVPDWGGLQARLFGRAWLHLDVPRHLYHFTGKALRGCLARAAFSVERQWHQELEYDLLGWSQSALNVYTRTPNAFFDCLTRKRRLPWGARLAVFGSGAALSALALPVLALGTLLRRGGSLIVAARPS